VASEAVIFVTEVGSPSVDEAVAIKLRDALREEKPGAFQRRLFGRQMRLMPPFCQTGR
jgi:hypothetical protein